MKKLFYFLIVAFTVMLSSCDEEKPSMYDQIGNISKPVLVYNIKLPDANTSDYTLTLQGGDNKFYEFVGTDDVIKTIIIRYGIGQELNGFDPVVVDSVKTETPEKIKNQPSEKQPVKEISETEKKWDAMTYDDRFSLLSYTLYIPDDEAKTLANNSWSELPDDRRASINKSFE